MNLQFAGEFRETLHLTDPEESLELLFDERSRGSIAILVDENVAEAKIHAELQAYSDVKVFIQNNSAPGLDIRIHTRTMKDARLYMGFLDLQQAACSLDFLGELAENGAYTELYTGQLCLKDSPKKNTIKMLHQTSFTYGNMHNFAVAFDHGQYNTVCDGTIGKGCPNSESHQETRVLTMGQGHKAEVIPILYIDENDVKASHALSIGQPDEQQLYYMCSRGLSRKQAVGLLSVGYFMPVIDFIDDEETRQKLQEEMERRVGLYEHQ